MKRYTKEFREQALSLSDDIGMKKAAEQLVVICRTLANRRKQRTKKAQRPENSIKQDFTADKPDKKNRGCGQKVGQFFSRLDGVTNCV
ncbi:MAG: hypothetical protein LKF96_09845 [Treponema sp.]|jgi:transposase|nr:hypothetical protein [Treponema sp.]